MVEYSLWPACVRTQPFLQQLKAASNAGYTHLPAGGVTIKQLLNQYTPAALKQMLAEHNVQFGHYDGFTDWAPIRYSSDLPLEAQAVFDFSADQVLRFCEELGISAICATAGFSQAAAQNGPLNLNCLADHFAQFCEKASRCGVRVDLEFIPFWGIPDIATAWDIVKLSEAKNAGILLDTWHFLRGNADFATLESLPNNAITTVQLADSPAFTGERSLTQLLEECLQFRLPPGQGQLPLLRVLQIVKSQTNVCSLGPEIFSNVLDQQDPERVARSLNTCVQDLLALADWPILDIAWS